MFRTLTTATFVLAAAPAAAQPASPECDVTIMRAPDDVRAAIEDWVRREPRCKTALEVRVVPTDGGLYLFARDTSGRTRDRIVPDATAVGVLVASWIADDSVADRVTIDGVYVPPAQPLPASVLSGPEPALSAPGLHDSAPQPAQPAPAPNGSAFSFGGFGAPEAAGLRFDLELPMMLRSKQGSAPLFTVTAGLATSAFHTEDFGRTSRGNARELRLGASFGGVLSSSEWQVRGRAGLLARIMTMDESTSDQNFGYSMVERAGIIWGWEVALLGARKVTSRWAVLAGPIVSGEVIADGLPDGAYKTEVSVYAGLAYGP